MPNPTISLGLLPRKRFMGTFQGIVASTAALQQVSLDVNGAWNHLEWHLNLGNLTPAMFQEIRVKANGAIFQKWNGADLDALLQYDKVPAASVNNVLVIPFRRFAMRSSVNLIDFKGASYVDGSSQFQSLETSLNVGAPGASVPITAVSLECDIINTGAGQPTLSLYSKCTDPQQGGTGPVLRSDKQAKTFANGSVSITKSEMGLDALRPYLNRLVFTLPGGLVISNVQLRYGTNDWWVVPDNVLAQMTGVDNMHNLPNGQFILDFQEEGWGNLMLDLTDPNSDIAVYFTASGLAGATNVPYYVISAGPPFAGA